MKQSSKKKSFLDLLVGKPPKAKRKKPKRGKLNNLPSYFSDPSKLIDNPSPIKRRLAFLIVTGKKSHYIRKQLHISQKTLDLLLQHPDIADAVDKMSDELFTGGERAFQHLWLESISRTSSLIAGGDPEVALQAIEMVWKAHHRLPLPGKGGVDVNIQNNNLNQGNNIENREDAVTVMDWLRQQKKLQAQIEQKDITPRVVER